MDITYLPSSFALYLSVEVNKDRSVGHSWVEEAYNGRLLGHRMMYRNGSGNRPRHGR
jgi:hypothetical protein